MDGALAGRIIAPPQPAVSHQGGCRKRSLAPGIYALVPPGDGRYIAR
jgi:hypothetical protein